MTTADTSKAAILQIKEDSASCNESSLAESSRSSISSLESDHDPTVPLELGLVVDALQASMAEQNNKTLQSSWRTRDMSHQDKESKVDSTVKDSPKTIMIANNVSEMIKRGDRVTVDYDIDRETKDSKTTGGNFHDVFNTGLANLITLDSVDFKQAKINTLTPREQEKADEPILLAIQHLFNNRFMEAKKLFEQDAQNDPLHAVGLGSMAFLKALMASSNQATEEAIETLMVVYNLATAQINNSTKTNVGSTVVQYFKSYRDYIKFSLGTGVPTSVSPAKPQQLELRKVNIIPNGILRAHVAKAEACLQIAILYLLQGSTTGYIKCGLNLRRAYASYSVVWQEYKRMGQLHNEYIDRDTISGVQFGIGTVHLILSSLPQKILRVVAAFGWTADKHLGFALLKLCLEGRRARSPLASLMLLSYYTTLISTCPQLLADDYTQPAIQTLLDAQRLYPNSAIFLYFAGRTSRLARNLSLSTQSFVYSIEASKKEWAEVSVLHMCSYEIGFNHMMQNNWEEAASMFDMLYKEENWSPVIFRYLYGACLDMMGQRTAAILAFAEIPNILKKCNKSTNSNTWEMEQYVLRKVKFFQSSGYQDMDMTMCAMEYLYLYNAFEFMDEVQLEHNLELTDFALSKILEAEKLEYGIRTRELLPETPPPQYNNQRGSLLLIKAAILNAMGCFQDSIIHLNWIMDHKDKVTEDKWIISYSYWEVGRTCWSLNQRQRAREFWEKSLGFSKYDFEYKLAMRVNLAIKRADEIGIHKPKETEVHAETATSQSSDTAVDYSRSSEDSVISQDSQDTEKEKEIEKASPAVSIQEKVSPNTLEEIEHVVDQLSLSSPAFLQR